MGFKFPCLLFLILIGSSYGNEQLINLECVFKVLDFATVGQQYTCIVQNDLNIFEPSMSIQDVTGAHAENQSITSVTALIIEGKKTEFLPNNIGEIFSNLIALRVKNGKLKELSKDDLKSMPNLRYLNLDDNDIEVLNDDVFENSPELQLVWLSGNKIKKIDENLVEIFKNLNSLDLTNNACTNKRFSIPQSIHVTPSTLKIQNKFSILTEIMQNCANFTEPIFEVDVQPKEDDHPELKGYKDQIKSLDKQLTSTKGELDILKKKFVEESSAKNRTMEILYELQNNQTLLTNEVEIGDSKKSIAELEIKLLQEEKEVRNLKDELKKLRGINEEFSRAKATIKSYENEKYNFAKQIELNQAEIRELLAANAALKEKTEQLQKQIPKTDTEKEIKDSTTASPSIDVRASETTESAGKWEPESSTNATVTTSKASTASESNDIDGEWGSVTRPTEENLNKIGRPELEDSDEDEEIERTTIYDYYT